jgi:CRP-like cAMP-binding protein
MLQNALLSVLRDDDRQRLQPHMLLLDLPVHTVLTHAGQDVVDTWFPCGGALAAFCIAGPEGQGVDVAFVGREGAIGGIVSNGNVPAYATAVVRLAGTFLRIKTSALEQAKLDSIGLRHWFARYSDCLLAQVFQTSACNAVHTIRQRVAKMILAGLERNNGTEFRMTQDQLADMLGVGRTFVSRVLGALRQEGIIETGRGMLVIKDLQALRQLSCHCTIAIEDHFDKVLHGIYPPPV